RHPTGAGPGPGTGPPGPGAWRNRAGPDSDLPGPGRRLGAGPPERRLRGSPDHFPGAGGWPGRTPAGAVTSAEAPDGAQVARLPAGGGRYGTPSMDRGPGRRPDRGRDGGARGAPVLRAAVLRATPGVFPEAAGPRRRLVPLRRPA